MPRCRRSKRWTNVSVGSPQAVEAQGGTLVITADHGNAEMMRDPETGEPHTAHTLNPVPFIVVNPPAAIRRLDRRTARRRCADAALDLLGPETAAGDDRPFADR
jgi:2,3-bisphosphoglycerate-independent phosphoglycerate mutase